VPMPSVDPGLRREDESGTPRLVSRRSSRLVVNYLNAPDH
jgi:hypothetical protein